MNKTHTMKVRMLVADWIDFYNACAEKNLTPSKVVRKLIADWMRRIK
jgi:hypothetical protein